MGLSERSEWFHDIPQESKIELHVGLLKNAAPARSS
jgi:hypothetical protein